MSLIGHCLKSNKNISIASTSKTKLVNTCHAIVEQGLVFSSEIIQVHSDTDIDVKREALTDLEAYCMKQKCRVLAFSPTITAGCDISTYPFETIIIYVSVMSIT